MESLNPRCKMKAKNVYDNGL